MLVSEPDQGVVYSAFIDQELKDEQARRDRLDARSTTVLTSSASLVALLASVGAFVLRGDKLAMPSSAFVPLVAGVSAFGISGFIALIAAWPVSYGKTPVRVLTELRTERWPESQITARNHVANLKIKEITDLRNMNNRRVRVLFAALAAQLVAVCMLIWVVGSLVVVALS